MPAGVQRLLTGLRPGGSLHLGHYLGVVRELLAAQHDHECFVVLADVQALVAHQGRPGARDEGVREAVLDLLAAGLDPRRCRFLLQSRVPELAELTCYLQTLVRTGELQGNPALREETRALGQRGPHQAVEDVELGLLGYPVAQAADVLAFSTSPPGPGDGLEVAVSAGEVVHVELARRLAERFHARHGATFLLPRARVAPGAALPGTGGGYAMGKVERHAILLRHPVQECAARIERMATDPMRLRRQDAPDPERCLCLTFLRMLLPDAGAERRHAGHCAEGERGCAACRGDLMAALRGVLEPIQERRRELERQPDLVADVLATGTRQARAAAGRTLAGVRQAIGLDYPALPGLTGAP